MAQQPARAVDGDPDDPRPWLCASPLYDLEDPKLRLRVQALTQLGKNDRERALQVYGFVKRLPLRPRMKFGMLTARQVYDAGTGDAFDKATLLVAMLRIAGLPARIRFVVMAGEILRGVPGRPRRGIRPLVEVFLHDRWLRTDTYIFDAACMAAARHRLRDLGWEWGYGIHVQGAMFWDGFDSAYLGGVPTESDPMVREVLGVFHDPSRMQRQGALARLGRWLEWCVCAPRMNRTWRQLRHGPASPAFQKSA